MGDKSNNVIRWLIPYYLSIPYYFWELYHSYTISKWYYWICYKLPHIFPKLEKPVYINIELTTLCNLECPYCWRKGSISRRGIGSIAINHFRKVMDETRHIKPILFQIGGSGEPALHPEFLEIMEIVTESIGYETDVVIYTNGTLFKKYSCKEIVSWKIDRIVVSIDGIDKKTYEKARLGGNYDLLCENVVSFHDYLEKNQLRKPDIEVRHVIMPSETMRQLIDFRKRWRKVSNTVKFQMLRTNVNQTFAFPVKNVRREIPIEWNGNVPVSHMPGKTIGNINDNSISELWKRMVNGIHD